MRRPLAGFPLPPHTGPFPSSGRSIRWYPTCCSVHDSGYFRRRPAGVWASGSPGPGPSAAVFRLGSVCSSSPRSRDPFRHCQSSSNPAPTLFLVGWPHPAYLSLRPALCSPPPRSASPAHLARPHGRVAYGRPSPAEDLRHPLAAGAVAHPRIDHRNSACGGMAADGLGSDPR
jgi:hypothetical protein